MSMAFQILASPLLLSTRLAVFASDISASVAQTRNRTNSYIYFASRLNIVTGKKNILEAGIICSQSVMKKNWPTKKKRLRTREGFDLAVVH